VKVGGPEEPGGSTGWWRNEFVNGAVVKVTPTGDTSGEAAECTLKGGEETITTLLVAGKQASCPVTVPPGTYDVSIPSVIAVNPGTSGERRIYATSEKPQPIEIKAGENKPVSFSTANEPTLTVKVGGPEAPGEGPTGWWDNELVNGAVVTVTPTGDTQGEAHKCPVEGGEETITTLLRAGKQASCHVTVPPGTYDVSVPSVIAVNPGTSGERRIYATSENPQPIELKAGGEGSRSFNTAFEPKLANTASGTSSEPAKPAEAVDGTVLSATASGGTGTVIVGQYESDPAGAPTFATGGPYIDVFLVPGNTFKELTFTDCDLEGGEYLLWYDSETGLWPGVSDETRASGNPPCITVTINETTTPNLKEMTGTVFGVALPPASTSTLSASLSPSLTTPPATTAATGGISLDGSTMPVKGDGAAVKLTCTGTATCEGKLTLTAKTKGKTTKGKGKGKGKKQAKTEAIGTAGFSIPAGKTATVKLTLTGTGRALVSADHGSLSATLTILKSSPAPAATQTESIHLTQQKATKAKKGKKK
jgi:hypothetical protein